MVRDCNGNLLKWKKGSNISYFHIDSSKRLFFTASYLYESNTKGTDLNQVLENMLDCVEAKRPQDTIWNAMAMCADLMGDVSEKNASRLMAMSEALDNADIIIYDQRSEGKTKIEKQTTRRDVVHTLLEKAMVS